MKLIPKHAVGFSKSDRNLLKLRYFGYFARRLFELFSHISCIWETLPVFKGVLFVFLCLGILAFTLMAMFVAHLVGVDTGVSEGLSECLVAREHLHVESQVRVHLNVRSPSLGHDVGEELVDHLPSLQK